ncbi:MAG TPA: hypothetical protein VKV41_18115 [Methylomirabilota bacterium]|jgi:hypothetical protein|nr:hypothetical protein [Methylomirabilota bacterium]
MIRAGLAVIASLQVIAAAAAYPILTLAIGLGSSFLRTATSHEAGARTVLFFSALPMAFGVLITAGVFVAVPLGVCVGGAFVLGLLGRRRGETVTVAQLLSFGSALVLINVVVMVAGVVLRPMWWYSEKLATLMPLWPLLVGFALNGVVDSVVTAVILRAQLRPRREGAG